LQAKVTLHLGQRIGKTSEAAESELTQEGGINMAETRGNREETHMIVEQVMF
jgi:hypothetical protein